MLRSLSSREQEVLRLLVAGKTNRQIAHVLGISPRTVEVYVSRIYKKLGVHSRVEVAVLYVTHQAGENPLPPRAKYRHGEMEANSGSSAER